MGRLTSNTARLALIELGNKAAALLADGMNASEAAKHLGTYPVAIHRALRATTGRGSSHLPQSRRGGRPRGALGRPRASLAARVAAIEARLGMPNPVTIDPMLS